MTANQDTFCVLPFVGMNVHLDGGLAPCCMQDHNNITHQFNQYQDWRINGLTSLKQDLIDGVRNNRCSRCWKQEDQQVKSYRQRWNDIYKSHPIFSSTVTAEQVFDLKFLHLDFDSFCNLKCIMCHPTVSSSLAAEYQSNQPLYEPFFGKIEISKKKWYEDSEFEKFIDQIYNIDTLILTGGEPLINPRVTKLLQTLPLANINLIVTTNATQISPLVFDLLNQAKTTGIIVSLEGVGAHNDYLRFGSKWTDIDLNIKKLSQLDSNRTIPVTINHVLQHTSIYSLPQVVDYAMINQHEINIHKLTFPPWLDLAGVPMEKRQWAINSLTQQIKSVHQATYPKSFKSWLESAMVDLNNTPYNPDLSEQFVKYIVAIDQTRQTNFQTTFGQLP